MQELHNQHNIDKKRQKRQIHFHKFAYFCSLHRNDKGIVFKSLRFQRSPPKHCGHVMAIWPFLVLNSVM